MFILHVPNAQRSAEIPVEDEPNSAGVIDNCIKLKKSLTEEVINGALVTPSAWAFLISSKWSPRWLPYRPHGVEQCRFGSMCLYMTFLAFWLCSHHRIITKFSGVITNDRSDVHEKCQDQRSKVKVTEVNTQLSRFRTVHVAPVWIHIWWWNEAQNLMLLRRGALLFFKVIYQISRSHG